jgi:hypothetical protein
MKKYLLVPLIIISTALNAQTSSDEVEESEIGPKIKHFALGAKVGIPQVLSGSLEVVLPILNNHFAPYFDFSSFSAGESGEEFSFSYAEYGLNFYLNEKGKGVYLSVGQSNLNFDLTFNDLLYTNEGQSIVGSGTAELNLNTTNLKLGIKTGGTLYFRFELGYALGGIPDSIDFTATSNGITESFSEEIPQIPGLNDSGAGIPLANIGIGIAF